jgi:hypothetical protein
MNLSLEMSELALSATVRKSTENAPVSACGWDVLDAADVSGSATPCWAWDYGSLGQLSWCLAFEELGVGCRDLALARAVRTFADVFLSDRADTQAPQAAEAFNLWLRRRRIGASEQPLSVRCEAGQADDGRRTWLAAGVADNLLSATVAGADDNEAYADRDMLACAAYAVGIGRRSLEIAQERASGRVITGRRLLEYQGPSHRLAQSSVDLVLARVSLWRSTRAADERRAMVYSAPAAVAACVSAALSCVHATVQIFGAAGTSDPEVTQLYCAAYDMAGICGSPAELWKSAGSRWISSIKYHPDEGQELCIA